MVARMLKSILARWGKFMLSLFSALLLLNCLAEYLLNKMMVAMDVLEKKYDVYHAICAILRVLWIFVSAWFAIPVPILLIGLFVLLFLNVIPYKNRRLQMSNFIMIIYLIYAIMLMLIISIAGLFGIDVAYMVRERNVRVIVISAAFLVFNGICLILLRYHASFLWKEDYDKSKVVIYTRFLFLCVVYHILDSVSLTLYTTSWIKYLLIVSGDIFILILIFNFMNYNYVFRKSEEAQREYEEGQVLIAQQYFEKEALKKISERDSLTDTYNRREIGSIMSESLKKGHKLACVFIDLDGLKRINDKYGHTYGDLMLKRFADACAKILEGKGYLARIGGDEFLLIFLDQEISYIEEYIRKLQLKLLEPEDEKEKICFSYGISYDESSVENYIIMADQRMYACKNKKRSGGI